MTDGVVVITGASRGIGAAAAVLAARAGWKVGINYKGNRDLAEDVVRQVEAEGSKAVAIQADVVDEHAVAAMFDTCERELGPITSLVNNAGITGRASKLVDADVSTLREAVDINMTGALICAREAAIRMGTGRGGRGGTIVNVSSAASNLGSAGEFVWYAATKGGMDSLTIGLGKELGPEGIRVNAVNPGLIETDIHEASGIENRLEKLVGGVPMGRSGKPEEVAETIVWLMSDAASYVSGAIVRIGGGR